MNRFIFAGIIAFDMNIYASRKMIFIILSLLTFSIGAQTAGLSGKITDSKTGEGLAGANIVLSTENGNSFGAAADEKGRYRLEEIVPGRYRMEISYVGYVSIVEAGFLMGSGPATNRDFALLPNQELELAPVEVSSARLDAAVVNPLKRKLSLDEVRRLPATFYDPARLLTLSPGVFQTNDQANHLSVRGNSPNRNLWRLQGLAIVNPNHTANGGTISDQPTLNGGGVNALSAQLLDNSAFYSGGLPVAYGNATSGTFDMRLRPGNTERRQHQLQAGFIGFDVATEGPFAKGKPNSGSYLVNYRYSFTGLLADMGADFGGEEIRFQDFSGHLYQPIGEYGELSVFGLWGKSSNVFRGDEAEAEEEKDITNVDFESDLLIIGSTYDQRIGRGKLSLGLGYSSTNNLREESYFTFLGLIPIGVDQELNQNKVSSRLSYSYATISGLQLTAGAELIKEEAFIERDGRRAGNFFGIRDSVTGSLDQAVLAVYGEAQKRIGNWGFSAGIRYSHYMNLNESDAVEPRLALTYYAGRSSFQLLAERSSRLPTEVLLYADVEDPAYIDVIPVTNQINLGWQKSLANDDVLAVNAYYQLTPDDFASHLFFDPSITTWRDLQFAAFSNDLLDVSNIAYTRKSDSRAYGIELSYTRPIRTEGWYYSANLSVFRSENRGLNDEWVLNRFSRDFSFKGILGREWDGQNGRGKKRSFGFNLSLLLAGGERFYPILVSGGDPVWITFYDDGRTDRMPTYFRPDLRLYRRKFHKKTTTTLSLDIQNLSGIENTAYRDYDIVTQNVEDRKQLGLIPVLSYRIEWR